MWYLQLTRPILVPEYYVPAPKGKTGYEGPLYTAYTHEGFAYEYQPGPPVPPEIPDIGQIVQDEYPEEPRAYTMF